MLHEDSKRFGSRSAPLRVINRDMERMTGPNSETTLRMLNQAAAGDAAGWGALLRPCHDRLRRMVSIRLDPRLQGRFDPSDVLQETYLDAFAHLPDYLREP